MDQTKANLLLDLLADRLIRELSEDSPHPSVYKNAIDFIKAVKIEVLPVPGSKVDELDTKVNTNVPFPRSVG